MENIGAANALDEAINQNLSHLNIKQKETVLSVVKTFVEERQDWWDGISKEQQLAIDKALAEMKAGKLTPHAEVLKGYGFL